MTGIQMDGRIYKVRVIYSSIEETASLVEGPNAGDMLSGRHERDLTGTFFGHSLSVEPDPRYPEEYEKFFEDITAPVDFHTITMPHGQGTVTYEAMVTEARHVSKGTIGGIRRWSGLSVSFSSIKPVRTPDSPGATEPPPEDPIEPPYSTETDEGIISFKSNSVGVGSMAYMKLTAKAQEETKYIDFDVHISSGVVTMRFDGSSSLISSDKHLSWVTIFEGKVIEFSYSNYEDGKGVVEVTNFVRHDKNFALISDETTVSEFFSLFDVDYGDSEYIFVPYSDGEPIPIEALP